MATPDFWDRREEAQRVVGEVSARKGPLTVLAALPYVQKRFNSEVPWGGDPHNPNDPYWIDFVPPDTRFWDDGDYHGDFQDLAIGETRDVTFTYTATDSRGAFDTATVIALIVDVEDVEADEDDKESVRDFALWKGPKPGEPSWSTAIGEGRPGWHIECSAMAEKYLGETIHIHAGGQDLVFPHHENEIAQSEGATGKKFVNFWAHNGLLNLVGEKMSKSTGNVIDPLEMCDKYGTDALRFTLAVLETPGRDIALDPQRMAGYRAFGNKIWNATRFVLGHLDAPAEASKETWDLSEQSLVDRWIISRSNRLIGEVTRLVDENDVGPQLDQPQREIATNEADAAGDQDTLARVEVSHRALPVA